MMTMKEGTMVVALSLILAAGIVLVQYEQPPAKPRPKASSTLLSIYQTARAAGADVDGDSTEEIVRLLVDGVKGAGSFSETTFRAPQFSSQEAGTALLELTLVDGVLIRKSAGSGNR